jgi:hypothetical protein
VNGGDVFPKILERKDGESTCFICQRNPAEGHIRRYDITVCRGCWDVNWDGWPREHEARIIEHLKQKGLPVPVRNALRLFPRQ